MSRQLLGRTRTQILLVTKEALTTRSNKFFSHIMIFIIVIINIIIIIHIINMLIKKN